jgi:hypothetical protein
MTLLFLLNFLPEIFFSFSILFFLIYNVYLTNNIFFNFPLIEIEIFNQLLIIFTLFLFLKLNIEFVQNDSIFFNSFGIDGVSIFFIVLSTLLIFICFLFIWKEKLIKELGGIGKFMSWKGINVTDSGGFQMYSPSLYVKSDERGVHFKDPFENKIVLYSEFILFNFKSYKNL